MTSLGGPLRRRPALLGWPGVKARSGVLVAAAAVLGSCADWQAARDSFCTPQCPPGTSRGQLTVTVAPPPLGAAEVALSGPRSFRQTVTATTTLEEIPNGRYLVSATSVRAPAGDAKVALVYSGHPDVNPVEVPALGDAQVQVTYASRGSGHLWIADPAIDTLQGFSNDQLESAPAAGASPAASIAVGMAAGFDPQSLALDGKGRLWVAAQFASARLVRYGPAQLATSSTSPPEASLTDLGGINALAFDPLGNLYLAGALSKRILKLAATDLEPIGTYAPPVALTLRAPLEDDLQQMRLAFDAAGNLYVSAGMPTETPRLLVYLPTALLASGAQTMAPDKRIALTNLSFVQGLAFDRDGNLWLSDFGPIDATPAVHALARLSHAQLSAASGETSLSAILFTSSQLRSPTGLAFDEEGNLWVANASARRVVMFPAAALVSSVGVELTVGAMLTGATSALGWTALAFNPPPDGFPLYP